MIYSLKFIFHHSFYNKIIIDNICTFITNYIHLSFNYLVFIYFQVNSLIQFVHENKPNIGMLKLDSSELTSFTK